LLLAPLPHAVQSLCVSLALAVSLTAQEPATATPETSAPAPAARDTNGVAWGNWHLLGSFDHPKGNETVEPGHKPEQDIRRMEAGEAWDGLTDEHRVKGRLMVSWKPLLDQSKHQPAKIDVGKIDFLTALPAPVGAEQWSEQAVVYLYRTVDASKATKVPIMFGSDDGVRMWLNGEIVFSENAARGLNVRDEQLDLKLQAGLNHLVVKVNNGDGGWAFQMAALARVEQEKINASIDLAAQWLLSRQLIDGSWGEQHGRYRNGATALAVYTLIKSGVSPRHPAVLEALAFLAESPTTMTYSAGCHLMALEATRDEQYLPWMEEVLGDLLSWQNRQGIWGYPDGHPDLSCTQFAALGLWAAARAGLEIPDRVWVDLANGVIDHQLKREKVETPPALEERFGGRVSVAGFSYRPENPKRATGSMTTAGIATLALILEQLGEDCPSKLRTKIERQMELGDNWMATRWTVSSNPAQTHWLHYYLYGMERIGSFSHTDSIGGRDWYWEGAEFLVNSQNEKGFWPDPTGRVESATCFALLFLKRASQAAYTDPHGTQARLVGKSLPKDGPIHISASGTSPATFWVHGFNPSALGDASIAEVEYYGREPDGEWRVLVTQVAERPARLNDRFAGRYTFEAVGEYEIKAVAICSDQRELQSGIAKIQVKEATQGGISSYPTDAAKNLMPSGQPSVKVSTGGNPKSMVDNLAPTRWTCAANDASPWIEIDLKRPVTVDRIIFSHARTRPIEQENNPRATRVRVFIDKDDPYEVNLDPGARVKSEMQLPESRSIRKIRFEVLAVTGGELGKAAVGFTEIELQGPRKRRGRR